MVTIQKFIMAVEQIATEDPGFRVGCDGEHGYCDNPGLIIGALRRNGEQWRGAATCNHLARNEIRGRIRPIEKDVPLGAGEIVLAAFEVNQGGYELEECYGRFGDCFNGDLKDYRRVGVVVSVHPLRIRSMSKARMRLDHDTEKWGYHAQLRKVEPPQRESAAVAARIILDEKDGKAVNLRSGPGRKFEAVGQIPAGAEVFVTGGTPVWNKVTYEGQEGYVLANHLRLQVRNDCCER